jgi:hypothetical protein
MHFARNTGGRQELKENPILSPIGSFLPTGKLLKAITLWVSQILLLVMGVEEVHKNSYLKAEKY